WRGDTLNFTRKGILSRTYVAHGDPSKVNDNFGFAVAHVEPGDEASKGLPYVVFDFLHCWRAGDFPPDEDGVRLINYTEVQHEIEAFIERWGIDILTFDQFNSVQIIGNLKAWVQTNGLPKRTEVWERTATAPSNWREAETFKAAL